MTRISALLFIFQLFAASAFGQIKEFYLTCQQSDFDLIYANYEQDIYIPVSLTYNGNTWPDATMRIRGDGSRAFPKKSLKVKLNTAPFTDGRTSLNFNAEWEDKTYIQQALASRLMKESGQRCFNAEHIRLHLNGQFLGLYLLVEGVDQRFLETRGMDVNGTLYKAALDGSSLSVFDVPAFHWEQKEGPDLGMFDLQQLIDDINDEPQNTYSTFVDQRFVRSEVVNLISMNILLSLGSTYYHNYFMYHEPNTNIWSMLPWDMDKTLSYYGSGFPVERSSTTWAPDNPYHEKAIHDDQLLSEIRARIENLEASIYNQAFITPILDSIQAVISASVAQDMTDDISDVPFWESKVTAYKNTFNQRVSNVLYQIDEFPRNFTIERIPTAEPGTQITLHWTPSESPLQRPISYKLFFGPNLDLDSTATIIIDNISDTLITFDAPTVEGQYYYKVQSYDGFNYVNGFDTYNPIVITDNVPDLVINEINYNSSPDFASGDWVEFYNPLPISVDITDWYVMDDQNDHVFTFAAGSQIEGNGYLILCRGLVPFQSMYPNVIAHPDEFAFGLSNGGDAVRLFHPSGLLVDEVFFSDTLPWPPEADGLGPTLELNAPDLDNMIASNWNAWVGHHGTPGATNMFNETGIAEVGAIGSFNLYPNPLSENDLRISFYSENGEQARITITDALGKQVFQLFVAPDPQQLNTFMLHPNLASSGVYLLSIETGSGLETQRLTYLNHPQ